MKIVTVGYLTGSGGAERQIILLSNQMAQRGHDVSICVLANNISPYVIDNKVNVVDLTSEEGSGRLRIFRRYLAFRKAISKIRPDVIIDYNLQSAFFSICLPKDVRGKVVYSERGDPYDQEYNGLMGIIRDFTMKHVDGVVFQSKGAQDFFQEDVKQKSVVIHNSVNIPKDVYVIPENREKRIVNVGRLHHQKNQRLLIDAFARIAQELPDYILEIYGNGALHDNLQHYIDKINLNKRILLIPSRTDVFDCIHKASLFVLTSDYEGMPNALMEAMALGLPCISTDCRPGGARSLINNGENGIIVPCNDLDSLVKAIKSILTNPQKAESLAREASKIGDTHSEKMVFDKWNDFIFTVSAQGYDLLLKEKLYSIFRFTAEFLNRNNLTWWAAYGTAIGAVRHHNIIPWDDDIDICMPREDFNKLSELKDSFEGTDYKLMVMGDDDLFTSESKIVLRDSSWQENGFLHCNTGIYIDIFPLDLVKCREDIIMMRKKIKDIDRKFYFSLVRPSCRLFLKSLFQFNLKYIYVLLCGTFFPYRNKSKYLKSYNELVRSFNKDSEGNYYVNFCGPYGDREIFKKDYFLKSIEVSFNDFFVKLPERYDEWLRGIYGDYMKLPPVEKRVSRHDVYYMNLSKRLTHEEILEKVRNHIVREL